MQKSVSAVSNIRKMFVSTKKIVILITLFFSSLIMNFNCLSQKVMNRISYHPLNTNNLCTMKILGKKGSLHSVSILMNQGNVTDLSYEEVVGEGYHVLPDSEFLLSQGDEAKSNTLYNIPCKKQFIRIQFKFENQMKRFDVPLQGKKVETISLMQTKSGGLFYEVK